MRVLTSGSPRPLGLLALGARGHVAAASPDDFGDGDADLWSLADKSPPSTTHEHTGPLVALHFTADGQFLIIGGWESICIVDVTTGLGSIADTGKVKELGAAIYPDDRLLAVSSRPRAGRLTCWDISNRRRFRELWQIEEPYLWFAAPAVSPDGRFVAVARRDNRRDNPLHAVEIRDAANGSLLRSIPHDAADQIEHLVFTADGVRLLGRSPGRLVHMFDAVAGEPAGDLVHKGRSYVTGVAVHPKEQVILTTRNDGTATYWDPLGLRQLGTFDWKAGKLLSAGFSPDGTLAAAGTADGRVIVWDVDL